MKRYDIPNSFGFTVLYLNEKLCHVSVCNDVVTVHEFELLNKYKLFRLYFKFLETKNIEEVVRFMLSRLLPITNPRWEYNFRRVGITEYKPYEYLRKKHGVFDLDKIWLYFDDEEDKEFRPPMYCEKGCELIEK